MNQNSSTCKNVDPWKSRDADSAWISGLAVGCWKQVPGSLGGCLGAVGHWGQCAWILLIFPGAAGVC